MKNPRKTTGGDAGETEQQQAAAEAVASESAGSEEAREGEGEGEADGAGPDSEDEEVQPDAEPERQAAPVPEAEPLSDGDACPDGMGRLYVLRDPIFDEVRHVGGCSAPLDAALLEALQHELAPSQANARWIRRLAARGMKPRIQALTGPLSIDEGKARLPAIAARYKAVSMGPVTSDLDPPEAESAE